MLVFQPRRPRSPGCLQILAVFTLELLSACTGNISGDKAAPKQVENSGGATGGSGGIDGTSNGGQEAPPDFSRPPRKVDFFADVQPILGDSCVRCHGGVRRLGKLDLITREGLERVLIPGKPQESSLLSRLLADGPSPRMPLGGKALTNDQILTIRDWIVGGGTWPEHWAYVKRHPSDPNAISVKNEGWIKDPIDRFVLAKLEERGLSPSPEASRGLLVRRLYLDLAGLPPEPAEVQAVMASTATDWYEKLVDKLLAAPAFGERWGRHWLDQARYADSDGWGKDLPRPTAWRFRDWVVDAFNKDMPFDQFTIEQIAGDLLPGATPQQKLAAGFHRQSTQNKEGGIDAEEDRTRRVMDRVSTVGTVWMGLTLACTQCHDHPYDLISQKDFYRMYAMFNNTDEIMTDVSSVAVKDTLSVESVTERSVARRPNYLFRRGVFLQPDTSEELTPAPPAKLNPPFTPAESQANRLDLAHWIVDTENPLTWRVTVNTLWSHLFGGGLVASLEDFGSRARPPTHPELLEHLADSLIKGGYRRKPLIKRIVMSATYRQSSLRRDDGDKVDAANSLLHRQNRIRVEAEILSDIVLSASGLLVKKLGGPCVYPPIPPDVLTVSRYGTEWPTSVGENRYRRGIYTFHKRTALHPNLALFDRPSSYVSVSGRVRSTTSLGALTQLNDSTFADAARALANRVIRVPGAVDTNARVDQIFWLTLGREPTADEAIALTTLIRDTRKTYEADAASATKVIGSDPPIGIGAAEVAAWVVASRVMLNLEETFTRE
jgi:hypothetical protein